MSKQSEIIKSEWHGFNVLFSLMGTCLLGIAGWIALSVAHLPAIEQKLDDNVAATAEKLNNHELRLQFIEQHTIK